MKMLLLVVLVALLSLSTADKFGVTSTTQSDSQGNFHNISKIDNDEIHDEQNDHSLNQIDIDGSDILFIEVDTVSESEEHQSSKQTAIKLSSKISNLGDSFKNIIKTSILDRLIQIKKQSVVSSKNQLLKWRRDNRHSIDNQNNNSQQTQQESMSHKNTSELDNNNQDSQSETKNSQAKSTISSNQIAKQEQPAKTKAGNGQNMRSLGSGIGTNLCLMFIGFIMVIIV